MRSYSTLKGRIVEKFDGPEEPLQAVVGLQFPLSLVELVRIFENKVDEVCSICSSKDIVQPLFYAETLNVK